MKSRSTFLITIFAFLLSGNALSQDASEKNFRIKVEVINLKSPAKLILTVRDVDQWAEYQSESSTGKFNLSGPLKESSFAWLVMKYGNELTLPPRKGNVIPVFLDYLTLHIKTSDSLSMAVFEGTPLQRELVQLNSLLTECSDGKCSDDRKSEIIKGFINDHPSSPVSIYAIQDFSMDGTFVVDANRAEPLFALLSPSLQNTAGGKSMMKDIAIAKQTSIGSIAPDFIQKDTVGRDVVLSSLRGKYVLIDFWASWCGPCRIENPGWVRMFEKFREKNFTIVSVSLDFEKERWLRAIRKDHLTWTHVSDLKYWKNKVALQYGVKTVPQNILLDPGGKIIGKNIRSSELDSILTPLLK